MRQLARWQIENTKGRPKVEGHADFEKETLTNSPYPIQKTEDKSDIFKVLKEKKSQPRISCPVKIFFKTGIILRQTIILRILIASRYKPHEILKEVLQAEGI